LQLHHATATCARNNLFLCCFHLPDCRQVHRVPTRVWGSAAASGQTASSLRLKTCNSPPFRVDRPFRLHRRHSRITRMREMKLQDLKAKSPGELVSFAEQLEVENAPNMRKQELMFGILKQLAVRETDIIGEGVVEVLSDGFGFLRAPEANYLPGPDDIYVSPSQIRRFGLRTGD